jgi:Protein of unknown function (DUF3326)
VIKPPFTTVLIVPTGVGASIGGYAGDALPVARAISQVCDRLITHPNVMNGAQLYWSSERIFYTEGYGLDQFTQGSWGLRPVVQNRIGIIFDQAIESELLVRHIQAAQACQATLGLDISDYIITDAPLQVQLQATNGPSWGTMGNSATLLRAAEKLIRQAKVEAVAVVARFPDDPESPALADYRHGDGIDQLAGAEAVISHLIVRTFKIPCAHAPALSPLPVDPDLSPRAAAEELGYTFFPCVLVGLSRAPQFILNRNNSLSTDIWSEQIDALIIPANACGGSSVLSLSNSKTKIIAVEENKTALNVTPEMLGIDAIKVKSYLEAIGYLVSLRAGINPLSLTPNFNSLNLLS